MLNKIDSSKVNYPGLEHLTFDPELSGKIFSNSSLKSHTGFKPGVVIYASDFSWETPNSNPWPDGMTGVTFIKCHLNNLIIPPGNTVIDCSQKRFAAQNDGNDWLIDNNNNPTLPVNHKIFTKFGLPMPDPADIPVQKSTESIDLVLRAREIKKSLEGLV